MTSSDDPRDPAYADPVVAGPPVTDDAAPPAPVYTSPPVDGEPVAAESPPTTVTPAPAPTSTTEIEQPEQPERGTHAVKVAAVLAGAAAIANKVREEAPKKVQEFREKRVAGRCVILAEVDGDTVAIGPYRDAAAAREDLGRVPGAPRVAELKSQTAYFGPSEVVEPDTATRT
jgi:hypothetical protein